MRHAENDIDVLKRCLSGSTESFEVIVGRYQSLVCGMTFASTGNLGKSEELAQETFILAWKNLRQLRDLSKFKSWLCQIVRNVVQNWRRSAQRDVMEHAVSLEHASVSSPSQAQPVERAIQEEEQAVMNQAIDAMPEKYRLALILFYREDKSSREVAQLVDLSENATRQRIARARAMLKDQVAAMVERNLAQSKPGKAFTGAVVASLAGVTMKGAATAVAAGAGGWAVSAGLSSLTAKVVAVAAGIAVLAGATYTLQSRKSSDPMETSRQTATVTLESDLVQNTTTPIAQETSLEMETGTATGGTVNVGRPDVATDSVEDTTMNPTETGKAVIFPVPSSFPPCDNCLNLTVVDKDSGDSLSGVELEIRLNAKRQTEVTNEAGQFQILFGGMTPDTLQISARAEGRVPTVVTYDRGESDVIPKQLSMRVEQGTLIGGLIQNEQGDPIEGSSVFLRVYSNPDHELVALRDHEVITDANGHWHCDIMPKTLEEFSVRLTHADYIKDKVYGLRKLPSMVALRAQTGVMVMKKGIHVVGWVFDQDNKAIAGASVATGSTPWASHYPKTRTNAEGYFEFWQVEPGLEAILTVQAKGFSPDMQSIWPSHGMEDTLFSLEPAHEIRGRIVDTNYVPIAGVWIAASHWRGHQTLKWRRNTNQQGTFVWTGAPADEVRFAMGKEGYMSNRKYAMTAGDVEHTIVMRRPQKVMGTVTYADTNEPAGDYTLTLAMARQDGGRPYWENENARAYRGPQFEKIISEPREYGRVLRVEAPNYAPVTSRVFLPDEELVRLDFVLHPFQEGVGLQGIVLLPDGSVAAGIDVALTTPERNLSIENGKIKRIRERSFAASTRSDGRFSLEMPEQAYRIAAVHEQGYAVMDAADFLAAKVLQLKPWARVEGTLYLGSRPGMEEEISVKPMSGDNRGDPHIFWTATTETDSSGYFKCDTVFPGSLEVSHVIRTDSIFPGMAQTQIIEVAPGDTGVVGLGGTGCPVVGRFVLPSGLDMAGRWGWGLHGLRIRSKTTATPARKPEYPTEIVQMPYDEQRQWIEAWRQGQTDRAETSPAPIRAMSYPLVVAEDGTFRVEDVIEGAYTLSVSYFRKPYNSFNIRQPDVLASGKLDFDIPTMENGRSDEAFDLGSIQLEEQHLRRAAVGRVAPTFHATDIEGQAVDLKVFQGKYVLLHFWQLIRPDTVDDVSALKRLADVFKDDERLVIVGLTGGMPREIVRAFTAHHQIPWIQIVSEDATPLWPYQMERNVVSYLVGPDGKIVAETFKLPEMLDAVTRELSR